VPRAQRQQPLWKQIADHYKDLIVRGELLPGDALPSIRAIRDEWRVSQGAAQQAVNHLHLAEHLVRTDPSGTYVDVPRAALGPQQRMRLAVAPASEVVTVTAAGLVVPPDYIVTTLHLPEGAAEVVRREQVTRRPDGTPHMLSVTWCAVRSVPLAPELLALEPLPDPGGAGHLIAFRREIDPDDLDGSLAFECRPAKDDGRERPALGLAPGAFVLAGVSGWRYGEEVLEYTEFILPPGQVVEASILA
jgi:GntR family transcriptional regulator